MRIPDRSLFIADLGRDFRPDAFNNGNNTGNLTTMAVGEEGGGATTLAVGEEGGGEVTTMAVGEEGGGEVTTMALGEEGGGEVTTMALGEEGSAAPGLGSETTRLADLVELFIHDFGR